VRTAATENAILNPLTVGPGRDPIPDIPTNVLNFDTNTTRRAAAVLPLAAAAEDISSPRAVCPSTPASHGTERGAGVFAGTRTVEGPAVAPPLVPLPLPLDPGIPTTCTSLALLPHPRAAFMIMPSPSPSIFSLWVFGFVGVFFFYFEKNTPR
jgi:hypothetical protein